MSDQMEQLLAMVSDMSQTGDENKKLKEENETLKSENQLLNEKLTKVKKAIEMILTEKFGSDFALTLSPTRRAQPEPDEVSDTATDTTELSYDSDGTWEEVRRKADHHGSVPYAHRPSEVRGTDRIHNPVINEQTAENMVLYNYKIHKMVIIPHKGYQPPGKMKRGMVWNFEHGRIVPFLSEENPYFKTNMCIGILRGRGCNGDHAVTLKSGEDTCVYCHREEELRPFRKFLYGTRKQFNDQIVD